MTREEIMVEENLGLVYKIAGSFYKSNSTIAFDEFLSYGMEGLWRATKRYDETKSKACFGTYAHVAITRGILTLIKKKGYKKNKICESFLSLDFVVKGVDSSFLENYADSSVNLEKDYINKELVVVIKEKINSKSAAHKNVLILHYLKEYSQREIAQILGKSHQWVAYVLAQFKKECLTLK